MTERHKRIKDFLEFHSQRRMFAVLGGGLVMAKFGIPEGHDRWLRTLGVSETEFPTLIRGYIHKDGIVFYRGHDFTTDQELENEVPDLIRKMRLMRTPPDLKLLVCCGVIKGEIGEIWPPLKILGTVEEVLTLVRSHE